MVSWRFRRGFGEGIGTDGVLYCMTLSWILFGFRGFERDVLRIEA